MLERVSSDIKEAMKAKDKPRLDALRMLKSRLLENKTAKEPTAEMDVVVRYYKQLNDSLAMYPAASEQAEKLVKEMSIVAEYMPQALSEAEVKTLIAAIVAEQGSANFGQVMRALSPQIKGRFDGKKASELVKEILQS